MFDIAWSELLIVAIVAIIVVGPKELPALLRTLGQMMGKLRRSADEFRRQFDEAIKEAGAEDLQREMHSLQHNNPLTQIRDTMDEFARDPFKADAPKTETAASSLPAEPLAGDLGPPPPPLPPQDTSSAASPAPAGEATPSTSSAPIAPQGPNSPAKETAANGSGHDLRVNGEHRPAS